MSRLVECVPNFSEGRDRAKTEAIVAAARGVDGVRVLDVELDPDHNRMVLSFVAPPEAAVEAAFRAAAKARELIDMNVHKGEHPRMGATDVIPFIPVAGLSLADCVALAQELGRRIGLELDIPVYLYGHAAARPERKDLAAVRKGQFEALKDAIGRDADRDPDFGPRRIHPTAGATAVGAREQIINFNVNLDTTDLEAGKSIAKSIRTSGGGLPELRAKEIVLSAAGGSIQISTVLTDYRKTSLSVVLGAVREKAAAFGAAVVSTEIVGLVAREALVNFAVDVLRVKNFDPKAQVLESRLESLAYTREGSSMGWGQAAKLVSDALASTDPTPGGGSGAAIAGAMGCALGQMAMGISLQSKKLAPELRPGLEKTHRELGDDRSAMERLTSQDAEAFGLVMDALKLPKDDPARGGKVQAALQGAAEVPLDTARTAARALARLKGAHALDAVASDLNCARHLLRSAALCAAENVRINTGSLKDREAAARIDRELETVLGGI